MDQQQPTADNKRFGKYLRKIREDRRLSLDVVEEMSLGLPERVTKSHLSRIENGRAIPSFPRMFTLSQIYGVPVSAMAERFELCLKAEMYPADAGQMSVGEMWQRAESLKRADRYGQALLVYESMLERMAEIPEADRADRAIEIEQQRINCLFRMGRHGTAKEKCEKLLNSTGLTPRQTVNALNSLATCCYKLDRFAVALMVIGIAETTIRENDNPEMSHVAANLAALKGNICAFCDNFVEAIGAYRTAAAAYDELSLAFEACRARLNMAACFIELGSNTQARSMLTEVLKTAEAAGYDRQKAFVLSHMGLLAYKEHDLDGAETYCLRSNQLARPREYSSVVFRNCFYLWRIAQSRGDAAGIKSNLKTLRTYLTRVERYLPEAEEFRAFLGGGGDA